MEARKYEPHYTVDDYVAWEGDWELWHGIAVSMSPSPTFRHQELMLKLARIIGNQLDDSESCHCRIVVEHDWRIADDTVVRPDIMVVCDPFDGDFLDRPPTLTAEVLSPATEDKDRHAKRVLYAAEGVKHYLMVEPEKGRVEALSLVGDAYESAATATLDLHPGCSIEMPSAVRV